MKTGTEGSSCATRCASSTDPGAGYCTSRNACGKPPKSWMVRGRAIAVTPVPGTYQCADTQRIAFGVGMDFAIARQPSVYAFVASAFIGLPWPKKIAGQVMPDYPAKVRAGGLTAPGQAPSRSSR